MNLRLFNIIIIPTLISFTSSVVAQSLSYKTLNTCKKDYTEILKQEEQDVASLEELPPGVYLARSVTQSLEKSDEKYFSYQSLLADKKTNPEVCYKGAPNSTLKTQAFIPTMIDRTKEQKWGHTFWSLSAVLDKLTGAVQSKRSLVPTKNYKETLATQGYKIISSQKTHDEFQIRLERNIASWKEIIVITYDQF